jgi:hypothetical protein
VWSKQAPHTGQSPLSCALTQAHPSTCWMKPTAKPLRCPLPSPQFVKAVTSRWPEAVLQFEDFSIEHALPLLKRYRDHHLVFNVRDVALGPVARVHGVKPWLSRPPFLCRPDISRIQPRCSSTTRAAPTP